MSEAIEQLPDGVYFNLPEEIYFAQRRISKSDIKKILVSPADWWAQSWLNEEPYPVSEDAQKRKEETRKIGRLYHTARLEPEKLHERFVRQLEKADYADEGILTSDADIKAQLKALEQPQTQKGEAIEDRARRLLEAGYDGKIWHLELEAWEAQRKGREPIAGLVWDQMMVDRERLRASPEIDRLLSDGAAEVSILYTCPQSGHAMSTRLDYLRGDGWGEFKTFANPSDKGLDQCLRDAIMYSGYYIDIVVQLGALAAARSLPAYGSEDGNPSEAEARIIWEIAQMTDEPEHHLIFQQKGGVPNIVARSLELWRLPLDAQMMEGALNEEERAELWRARKVPSFIHAKALLEIERAKRLYDQYSEIYEPGEAWLPFDPTGVIGDEDYPPYWLEKEIKQ